MFLFCVEDSTTSKRFWSSAVQLTSMATSKCCQEHKLCSRIHSATLSILSPSLGFTVATKAPTITSAFQAHPLLSRRCSKPAYCPCPDLLELCSYSTPSHHRLAVSAVPGGWAGCLAASNCSHHRGWWQRGTHTGSDTSPISGFR